MKELESINKSMSEMFRQHDYRAMYDFYNNYIRIKLLQALQQREKPITLEEIEYRIKEEYKKHKDLDWAKIAASKIYSVIEQQRESDKKIDLAIKEFKRRKEKATSLRDTICLDGVLAVLDGIKALPTPPNK